MRRPQPGYSVASLFFIKKVVYVTQHRSVINLVWNPISSRTLRADGLRTKGLLKTFKLVKVVMKDEGCDGVIIDRVLERWGGLIYNQKGNLYNNNI